MSEDRQPPTDPGPPAGFVEVQRSMRLGPLAAGVGVGGIIVAVAATALFGLPGPSAAPATTATVAATSPRTSLTSTARPSPATTASSSLVTLVPNSPLPTPTPTAGTTSTRGRSATASPTVPSPYPDVQGYQECARPGSGPYAAVGTANESTSCGFAVNIWSAYRAAGLNGASGTVTASSPATGKTYQVTCSGGQPVRCSGGNNGRVLIYGGRLV